MGAFKMRGACNAIFSLTPEQLEHGILTHSSGNHGQAVAIAAKLRGRPATVIMPKTVSKAKRQAVEGYGAKVILCEPTLEARTAASEEVRRRTGATFIHPFDDARVIAGQGTLGLEFYEQVPDLDVVIVPVGGGGCISGVAAAMCVKNPNLKIIGVEPEHANDAQMSLSEGSICSLERPKSIADGLLASRVSALTFAHLKRYVHSIVTVTDDEILDAMQIFWQRMKIVVEPSGAVGLAAVLAGKVDITAQKVGLVITGGNVDFDVRKIFA